MVRTRSKEIIVHPRIKPAIVIGDPALTVGLPPALTAATGMDALSHCLEAYCVPDYDPMADGMTIQRSSRVALEQGVSLAWILDELAAMPRPPAPIVLMSYLNPLLNYGYARLAADAAKAGVCGFIVPDLPLEEDPEQVGAGARRPRRAVRCRRPAG